MNIDMSVLEFPDSIKDRAKGLWQVGFRMHPYSPALYAIVQSGSSLSKAKHSNEFLEAVEEDRRFRGAKGWNNPESPKRLESIRESIQEWLKAETEDQATLAQNGITDEATAIAFLDLVEPVIKEWTAKYDELRVLQEREMDEFFGGLTL